MAAVNQPGSRAGLITALVIFVLLFFIAAMFAVTQTNKKEAAEQSKEQELKVFSPIIARSEIPDGKSLLEKLQGENPSYKGLSLYSIVVKERNDLAKVISGYPDRGTKEVIDDANAKIAAAAKMLEPLKVQVQSAPITRAITDLAEVVVRERAQVTDATAKTTAVEGDLKKQITSYEEQVKTAKDAVAAAEKKASEAEAKSAEYRQTKDVSVVALEKSQTEAIEKAAKEKAEVEAKLQATTGEKEKLVKDLKKAVEKIGTKRPTNLAESAIRRADGKIVQVSKSKIVYIDLGQGQQISRGLTFEVYSKEDGIPPSGSDDLLPQGKAAIEVVNVGPGTSECRVIRTSPGEQIFEGDIIANLIYDRNVKWIFKVYGKFDIDQNGQVSDTEAEIVKRLIVQWGGKITDKIDIDTDFIVMGKEPTVQSMSKEEREEPTKKLQHEKEEAALKEFEDVKNKALELHIPVLNQNRFLYMVGFFDQGKKLPG